MRLHEIARPKTRHPDAKQLSTWLSPSAFRALDGWKALHGYKSRTATLEQILRAVGARLADEAWVARGLSGAAKPEEDCPEVAAARAIDQGDYEGDPFED